MSFLSGYALGVSALNYFNQTPPIPTEYQSIKFYGNNGTYTLLDNIHLRSTVLTDTEVASLDVLETPLWTSDTLLLATFDETLSAGNITNIINPITNFDIYRRKSTESKFIKLATLPVTDTDYIDATLESGSTYVYNIVAKNTTEASEPLQVSLDSDFYLWAIIDPDTFETHVFNFNLESNAFNNEIAYKRFDGYGKYSTHMFGDRDFLTGNISAIASSNCGTIEQSVDYVHSLRTFINNGKTKILKSRKGQALKVITHNFKSEILDDAIGEQPYIVSFDFEEVGVLNG